MATQFIVICRADRVGRRKGPYVLVTRQIFTSRDAAETYASSVSPSRQPLIVSGRFDQLRFPAA